jgi:hypothetical protein
MLNWKRLGRNRTLHDLGDITAFTRRDLRKQDETSFENRWYRELDSKGKCREYKSRDLLHFPAACSILARLKSHSRHPSVFLNVTSCTPVGECWCSAGYILAQSSGRQKFWWFRLYGLPNRRNKVIRLQGDVIHISTLKKDAIYFSKMSGSFLTESC